MKFTDEKQGCLNRGIVHTYFYILKDLRCMDHKIIYSDDQVKWIVFGRDSQKPNAIIDTNEYAIESGNEVMILDPGGTEIFPYVLSSVSEVSGLEKVKKFFCSHQDPDIFSSLPLWMALCPNATIYMPRIWANFMSHFGKECAVNFYPVPDQGMRVKLGSEELQIIPAHYLHASGNINLFCSRSRILFSGDIGSALVPLNYPFFVENFNDHIPFMRAFHQRWMPSESAKKAWIRHVRSLKPHMICPQHGAIIKGEKMVGQFLDWLDNLEVGILSNV